MPISLDTFILGGTTDEIFATVLGDEVLVNDFKINIYVLKISSLKEYIWLKKNNKFSINDPDNMNLWKVDVGKDKLKDVDTEEKIRSKLRGEKMRAGNFFTDYFKVDQPVDRNVHIIIAISTTDTRKRLKISRSFTHSSPTDPNVNFYVDSKEFIEKLGYCALQHKFYLLLGHRQSGKTTIAMGLKRWLEDNSSYVVYYLNFNTGITTKKDNYEFWKSVCLKVLSVDTDKNIHPEKLKCKISTSFIFSSFFNKSKDVVLIIDDVSILNYKSKSEKSIIDDFISMLRVLKEQRRVCSIVLIGTEVIKKFLLPSSRHISPFSAEQEFYTTRFTSKEVKNLFTQYVEENKLNVDVDDIVADIYSLTLGHKGLVGICCYYFATNLMVGTNEAKLCDWEKHTLIQLPQYIKEQATYKSIIQCLKDLNENEIKILSEVLYQGNKQLLEDINNIKVVEFLLAEGIIVKVPHTNYGWMIIECAAPILRNIMLSRIHGPTIKPSSPIDTTNIDPEWLLACTIENMSIQDISHKYTFNANNQPSEYAFQAEFLSIFKQLISTAYPHLDYHVLSEVREYDEEGQRHQRLNILIHDKDLPIYGFELSVAASDNVFDNHLKRSHNYCCVHECNKMYTINICPSNKLRNYFGKEKYNNVIPIHVICDMKDGKTALVSEKGEKVVSLLI